MAITTTILSTANATPIYTSVGNTAITSLTFCNYSPATASANVFVVPSGNSASTVNQMWYALSLPSGDTYQLYQAAEKLILGNGDTIQANITGATANVTAITSYTTI